MKRDTKRNAATAGVGVSAVASGAALRHHALERVYEEKGPRPIKRPRLWAERRFIGHPKGRRTYVAASALGLLGTPAAAVGVNGLMNKRNVLSEGLSGATDAFHSRTDNMKDKPPKKLVLGNYASSLAIGSATGGITHAALSRRKKFPGGARSALAVTGGVVAGSAALPLQAKATQKLSRGRYTATPTGVQRVKAKPVRPSSRATVLEGRGVNRRDFRRESIGKAGEDPGANMTRVQRRAAILASGPPIPVVGDALQAAQASRLAPEGRKKRAAVGQYAATNLGGLAGNVAGATGAVALANRSPKFDAKATAANDAVDRGKARARAATRLPSPKPSTGPSRAGRALDRAPRVRGAAGRVTGSRVGRMVRAKPAVATIGALVGGAVVGNVSSNAAISHQLTGDDKYRARMAKGDSHNGHGSRVSKLVEPKKLSHREDEQLRRRKANSAAVSMLTGGMGLTAFGATLAAPTLRRPRAVARFKNAGKVADRLDRAKVPLLTAGAGIGGANGIQFARVQRKEAASKAFGLPRVYRPRVLRPTGLPRRPAMGRGYVAQRRSSNGTVKTYSVRGGLG